MTGGRGELQAPEANPSPWGGEEERESVFWDLPCVK